MGEAPQTEWGDTEGHVAPLTCVKSLPWWLCCNPEARGGTQGHRQPQGSSAVDSRGALLSPPLSKPWALPLLVVELVPETQHSPVTRGAAAPPAG